MMNDDDLKKLAIEIVDGKVFGSWMLPEKDIQLIANVFMPIAVGGSEHLPEDVACLYEYFDKRLDMSINGYPTFLSCKFLTKSEQERIVPMIESYKVMKQKFIQG